MYIGKRNLIVSTPQNREYIDISARYILNAIQS
jgi:hypothetical protein